MKRASRTIRFGPTRTSGRRTSLASRAMGVLAVLAFVFAGDLVLLHGHGNAASSADCAACVVHLPSFRDAPRPDASPAPLPPSAEMRAVAEAERAPRPSARRVGGLRDPPAPVSR